MPMMSLVTNNNSAMPTALTIDVSFIKNNNVCADGGNGDRPCLRQFDIAEHLKAAQTDGLARFDLPFGDGQNTGADGFRHIACAQENQCDHAAGETVPFNAHFRQAVIQENNWISRGVLRDSSI